MTMYLSKIHNRRRDTLKIFKSLSKCKELLVLDIGSHSIKVVVGKYEKNKIFIYNAFRIPIPSTWYIDGKIINTLEIKEVLKTALNDYDIKTKFVVCTIESTFTITREIIVPAVKKEELNEMIRYEIEEYMPIELDKYVIQHRIIQELVEDKVKKYKILVAALPTEIVLGCFELINLLDLNPVALDLHFNGICKLLDSDVIINSMDDIKTKTIAIVDLGHTQINVIIAENGIYKFSRIIDMGVEESDVSIANYLNIDFINSDLNDYIVSSILNTKDKAAASSELQSLKKGKNIFFNSEEFFNAIKPNIENRINEINKVFKYYTNRSSNNRIHAILIHGEVTTINGLDKHMTEAFNIPTYKIDKMSNLELKNNDLMMDLALYLNGIGSLIRR